MAGIRMLQCEVIWSDKVEKQILKLPRYIQSKFDSWVSLLEEHGIYEIRRMSGFHDEPLKGRRFGQRSVRLNKAYRVIYVQSRQDHIEIIEVIEVNKHEY
jgi:proteic killer suppression protein